jgi:ABC transport system ATP-binding/permease protein
LARRELAWLRRGAKARSRKPQARIDAAVRLIEGTPPPATRTTELERPDTPRLGDKVIECVGVGFRYDSGPVVLSDVNLVIDRRERLGIVGANGSGKSTLLDLLAGRRQPTVGQIDVGPTVVVGYYDQLGAKLDLHARVQELVAGPHRTPGSLPDIELMKRFLFTGELPFARVGTLSGGERRRLQLLLVIAARPNVLFLDEPTNDLDLDTLRILEDFLEEWPGALVVVSHDRTFLERTTDHLVAVGTGGTVSGVPGGVSGWIARVERGDARRAGALPATTSDAATATTATASATSATRSKPTSPRASSNSGARGSVPTNRLLREAEKNMVKLQRQRDKIVEALTGITDHVEMNRLGAELAVAQAALNDAEETWLALAEDAEA